MKQSLPRKPTANSRYQALVPSLEAYLSEETVFSSLQSPLGIHQNKIISSLAWVSTPSNLSGPVTYSYSSPQVVAKSPA